MCAQNLPCQPLSEEMNSAVISAPLALHKENMLSVVHCKPVVVEKSASLTVWESDSVRL